MSELVLLHHNEPMTTSETLASGVDLQHKNVVALIRKHVADLSEWGEVAFQTRLNPQGSPTEFAWLNEGQSLFLLTLMKNSPVVVAFKKALVKAFLELRDRLLGTPSRDEPLTLSHRADIAVAADRTFRSFLRSARSAGLRLPQALRQANSRTIERTGIDMLAELAVDPDAGIPASGAAAVAVAVDDPVRDALTAWAEGAEAGRFYTMADILRDACGVSPKDDAFQRIAPRAGGMLRSLGFQHRRARLGGPAANFWIKG